MIKSLSDQAGKLTNHFDISQKLKSFDSRQLFAIFTAFAYIYLISIFSIFFFLEKITRNKNVTYRLSLQSQMGFGVEPSSLVIFMCFVLTILFLLLLIIALRNKTTIFVTKIFGELLFPSSILFTVTGIGFLFGKIDLRLNNYSLDGISKIIWESNSWRGIAIFGIAILISVIFSVVQFIKTKIIEEKLTDLSYIPWLIPVIINTGVLLAVTSASTASGRFLIWFIIILNLILLILFSVYTTNHKVRQLIITMVLGISVFVFFYSHRPTQILTWRPDLQLTSIANDKYLVFSLLIALIICIYLIISHSFNQGILVIIAGLWAGFGSHINSTIVSSLDNFHYGEFIGYWLGFSEFDQMPYKSVEFPRGLFVNVLPAAFGNLLSNGYPETFTYWFIFLSFLIGILFFLVGRSYLPVSIVFLLLILIPKPNGYFEIDLIMGIALLGFVSLLQQIRSHVLLFAFTPFFVFFLILLTPGQGFICAVLLLIVGILHVHQNKISLLFLRRWYWGFYLFGILVIASILVLPSLLWVGRNGTLNNVMYGDFWMDNIFALQQFPLSLKFGIIIIAPIFLIILLMNLRRLESLQKQLGLAAICYLLAISGRWFGRVDQLDMSRIGSGLFIFFIVFLVPLTFHHSTFKRVSSLGFVSITLTICLGIAFYPFNQSTNFQQVASPSQLSAQFSEMQQRGQIYKKIKELEISLYGDNARRLNLTGGQAIDQYLGTPSLGGIESPYVITNDAQESEWNERLKKAGINVVLGPYGSLGAGAFDGSGIGGRAPQVLSWVINGFIPVDCGLFMIAIPKSDISAKSADLNSQGCLVPTTRVELLSLWNRIDSTQSNLGWSLISWKSNTNSENRSLGSQGVSIKVSLAKPADLLSLNIRCSSPQLVEFYITSNDNTEDLRQVFTAQVQSGTFRFKPAIFPITTILDGKFTLGLNSTACSFE